MLRLLPQHLAHLRAVAEGVPIEASARRYLGIVHGAEAPGAHRAAVDLAAAVARRHGDSRWRLLPLSIPEVDADAALPAPRLEEWAEAEGLADWSIDELESLYSERFPAEPRNARRRARNERLRRARLNLLRDLQAQAAEPAKATDQIAGWLDAELASRLLQLGYATLGELQGRIAQGGRWWTGLPAFGRTKAARVERQLLMLLGPPPAPAWLGLAAGPHLDGRHGTNRAPAQPGALTAANDREAMQAWVAAKAGSPATARTYEREAERFMLWMLARGRALSDADPRDCRDYMTFLTEVPPDWISHRNARRLQAGWAPFSGPLSVASQRQAITIVAALFAWLADARYLAGDPWVLVNRRVGDAPDATQEVREASRAFTPAAWDALHAHLPRLRHAAAARMRWIIVFVRATGLRPSELIRARRGHLIAEAGSWWLRVLGKGKKARLVPVPTAAMHETRRYFEVRGIAFDGAPADTALLGALKATEPQLQPLHYASYYAAFTRFVRAAFLASDLDQSQLRHALRASAHWLRHTHATRAAEEGVQPDVLQANLGQADPRSTARYYHAQMHRRRDEMERVYGQ